MEDVIIIGAGAIGCFVSRELSKYNLSVLLLDKENDVGNMTSMANSAIVHSGYDPVPGTKKAYFNVKGNSMFPKLCEELDVTFYKCGSLTVAINEQQLDVLNQLKERSIQNGVQTEILNQQQLREIEPNISPDALGALLCPTAGVVDPFNLVAHACENALDNGVKLKLNEEVVSIKEIDGIFEVTTKNDVFKAKCVVNCAGLFSDKIAATMDKIDWTINPRKGEYYVLDHYAPHLVDHVLFPLPSEKGKGILVSLTSSGNYICGPSSEPVEEKDDCTTDSLTLAEVKRQAMLMIPKIPWMHQIRTFAGVRATPSTHDFIIEPSKTHPHFINCAGIESPGLVSSPAIGKYVVEELISKIVKLEPKSNWNPCVKKYHRIWNISDEERNKLIAENPNYGVIVCNCEKVALGEIEDILSRSVPVNSVKALKKRSRAGFGRCQGGFCQPKVLEILAKHNNLSKTDVVYDKLNSKILLKESK